MNNELYHYGVLGMKWGVRRYQNYDGSYTAKGRQHYDIDADNKKKRYNEKYYKQYIKDGVDKKTARMAAEDAERTKKILKIVGGVAVASLVAYGVYRYHDYAVDSFVAAGQRMQTVHHEPGDITQTRIKPGNPFYASFLDYDNKIFASGIFGRNTDETKVASFISSDGIKIASDKTGFKVFKELYTSGQSAGLTDDETMKFRNYVDHLIIDTDGSERSRLRKAWNQFNISLVVRNDSKDWDKGRYLYTGRLLDHDGSHNIFYEALSKRGYGGVIDTNDAHYFAKKPVIIFDKSPKTIVGETPLPSLLNVGDRLKESIDDFSTATDVLNKKENPTKLDTIPALVAKRKVIEGWKMFGSTFKRDMTGVMNATKRTRIMHPETLLSDPMVASTALFGGLYVRKHGIGLAGMTDTQYVYYYKKAHPNTKLKNRDIEKMYQKLYYNY